MYPNGLISPKPVLDAAALDGKKTVFYIKSGRSLFSIRSNGTDKKELLKNVIMFQLSPDGEKLMAESEGQNGANALIALDLANYKSSAIDFGYDFSSFQWSPDGKKIAYIKVFNNNHVYTRKLIIHNFGNSQNTQSELDNTFNNIKWLNDGVNILIYTNHCDLTNKNIKNCYGIYNLNSNSYSQFKLSQMYENGDLIGQIHFNQSYFAYTLQLPSESVSFDRKYKLETKNNDLYLATLADDNSNWGGVCKNDNVPQTALKKEKKDILVNTRGCMNFGEGGCWPNFTGLSWFADNRFANVVYLGSLYILDTKNKKLYYLDNGLGLQSNNTPITYIPNYKPALPTCALDEP